MSDTPTTDKVRRRHPLNCDWVRADHMEELERELAASTAESIDLFKQLVAMRQQRDEARRMISEINDENERLRAELAAAIKERDALIAERNREGRVIIHGRGDAAHDKRGI